MTIGEKRVGVKFNPSKSELVDQIKQKTAELINLCESMKAVGSHDAKFHGEKNRCISLAQTNYETAAMYAVKANFTE